MALASFRTGDLVVGKAKTNTLKNGHNSSFTIVAVMPPIGGSQSGVCAI
ncbi:hypothetical protein [Deinococcus sp. QL22]|nr:hypothetical protein [Deinococcus sp. QL22]UQN05420.1 hypothetical protein M1R55_11095 [Deinococcus sp. QL22]